MRKPRSAAWIETLASSVRRSAAQFCRIAAGPDLHVTLLIARVASQARARRRAVSAEYLNSRTER